MPIFWCLGIFLALIATFTTAASAQSTITVEEAKTLAGRQGTVLRLHISSLSAEVAAELLRYEHGLYFLGLKSVPDEVAEILATHKDRLSMRGLAVLTNLALAKKLIDSAGPTDHFDGLRLGIMPSVTTVSDDVAKLLAEQPGRLEFPKLASLSSKELAERLSEQDELSLPSLTSLTPEVAGCLAQVRGTLQLGALETLSAPAARELAKHAGDLHLAMKDLSPEAAHELQPHAGGLHFKCDAGITPALAKELAGHSGPLHLYDTTELLPEVASLLIKVEGPLGLHGLSNPDDETQRILSAHTDRIDLPGLEKLTCPELAKKLGTQPLAPDFSTELGGPGCLVFEHLAELSPDVAAGLAMRTDGLYLPMVTAISDEVATILSGCPGYLDLSGLTVLDDSTAKVLSRHRGRGLALGVVSEEAAASLASYRGRELTIYTKLSDEVAKFFGKFRGDSLYLLGVTTLSKETAKSLGEFKGSTLGLPEVTTLSDEAVKGLVAFSGKELDLSGVTEVTPTGQDLLAEFPGRLGPLFPYSLGTLDSKALAKRLLAEQPNGVSLNSLASVADEPAGVLIQCKVLQLGGLRSLSHPGLARKLVEESGSEMTYSVVPQLVDVSPDAATELAKISAGTLDFTSLRELSPDVARELVKYRGRLNFGAVTSLSDAAAAALSEHKGGVSLPGLESLTSPQLAKVIVRPPEGYTTLLPCLRELSDEAAAALAERGSSFSLTDFPDLTVLTSEALARHLFAHFRTWEGRNPPTTKLIRISPEVAKVVCECRPLWPKSVYLDGLLDLDAATARALAGIDGYLSLDGLTSISPEVATELARHAGAQVRGAGLSLNGLKTISEDVAKVLATHAEEVSLEGLEWETLSEGARAIVLANPKVLIMPK